MISSAKLFVSEREKLLHHFQDRLETAHHLNRKAVSFQANKSEPIYRWFKYKEGFSSALVKRFLSEYSPTPGRLLDPFAGAGTSLFAGHELGWQTSGIELLPVGSFAVRARHSILRTDPRRLSEAIKGWKLFSGPSNITFQHLKITNDAFSKDTETRLNSYLSFCETLKDSDVKTAMQFAAFSILEQISFTRKDGQYLRWDYRSNRTLSGKAFDKGFIPPFDQAIETKFDEILTDAKSRPCGSLFEKPIANDSEMQLVTGSCLDVLPATNSDQFDFVITSPPYCNRYDYTRTYALELAFLGLDDDQTRRLRQEMLSCTVENKDKVDRLRSTYENIGRLETFDKVMTTYEGSEAMTEVNIILEKLRNNDQLNNKNITRMVRNYFLEMCFVVYELARVTKPRGFCVMVNDNVRYGGEEIPADLILSEFAQEFGYRVERIFVLPRGKGNSSQQMGEYGRSEVRKCVYLWRKVE